MIEAYGRDKNRHQWGERAGTLSRSFGGGQSPARRRAFGPGEISMAKRIKMKSAVNSPSRIESQEYLDNPSGVGTDRRRKRRQERGDSSTNKERTGWQTKEGLR